MELTDYLEKKRLLVNEHLKKLIPECTGSHKTLYDAARYSLNTPGKRLRPILTLAAVEMLKGNESLALTPACTIELIHTYSLIHDDLPCMDNDDFRRGLPTLHKVFPEGIAVLAGDFLLTHAFQVISHCPGITDTQKINLISILATRSGSEGMIGGQVMDIEAENKETPLEVLKKIHQQKTGALISASLEFGAILGSADDETRKQLKEYGEIIGLCFQIVDDLLDVTNSEAKHGKATSSDISNNKSTYVSILGYSCAKISALNLADQAKEKLKSLPLNTTLLQSIADFVILRTY